MPCSSQTATSPLASGEVNSSESSFWRAAISAIARASSIWCRLALERPIQRIFPSS